MRPQPKRASFRPLKLKEWLRHRNKTQEQLAAALEMSKAQISRIALGRRAYTQQFLERAADYLQCEPAHLINVDPTDPDGVWSIWETLQSVPVGARPGARRIIEALAAQFGEPGGSDAGAKPKRRKAS